ncbi:IS110 family transposase [Runella aurantiaca]|uniref:IS110 family transposase n=1 Tax=Runella aurantiaca TaxID=2282308 RepID=A0A369IDB4_9BACT|nr:IS110 family transposase [Runella aurantiaca]RDB04646.1 IS110 family transposase [Runella aurantiaca]
MEIRYYIGIDVSKATLDWAVFDGKTTVLQTQSPNSEKGIKTVLRLLKELPDFSVQFSIICLEHTGIYNAVVLQQLVAASFPVWLESSLQIKQAGGLQRGKSDQIDAQRIAEYAFRFRDCIRIWQPPRQLLKDLTNLSALRQRLLLVRSQLQQPIDEQAGFVEAKQHKELIKYCRASLKSINSDLEKVNQQMAKLIENDQHLKELFTLMTSIPGVGSATATEVILATDEFKAITDPKKLACHAGVAPFEHRSGTSVRGKTRVSQHARKRLKSLFHLAAMSAIRSKGEIKDYYVRKVAEGKNKMLVLNAVRNKIIHRIYAVVRRGEKYDKNYINTLA